MLGDAVDAGDDGYNEAGQFRDMALMDHSDGFVFSVALAVKSCSNW